MPTQHRILSLLYDGFEALDLFGPLGAILPQSDYYTVKTVDIQNQNAPQGVESSIKNGIGIPQSLSLAEALKEQERFDTLFIPGALSIEALLQDPGLLRKIGQLADRAANVFTVCTGSLVLAATGRLDGRRATTNKLAYDKCTPKYPGVQWQKRARWVQDGKFLTSSGITAGIDTAFAFLSNTYVSPEDREANPAAQEASVKGDATAIPGFDKEKASAYARSTAAYLEYRWNSDPDDDPFANPPQSTKSTV